MVQLKYWMMDADGCGIKLHPVKKMEVLGYKIIHAVPQTIGDQWWFTVDRLIELLPEYLEKMKYDMKDWGFYKEWYGGALDYDGLLSICQSYNFDPEKIGLHMLTVLANWNKVEVWEERCEK